MQGSMGRQVAEVEVCDSSGKAAISTGGNFLCGSNFKEQKTTRFQSAMWHHDNMQWNVRVQIVSPSFIRQSWILWKHWQAKKKT